MLPMALPSVLGPNRAVWIPAPVFLPRRRPYSGPVEYTRPLAPARRTRRASVKKPAGRDPHPQRWGFAHASRRTSGKTSESAVLGLLKKDIKSPSSSGGQLRAVRRVWRPAEMGGAPRSSRGRERCSWARGRARTGIRVARCFRNLRSGLRVLWYAPATHEPCGGPDHTTGTGAAALRAVTQQNCAAAAVEEREGRRPDPKPNLKIHVFERRKTGSNRGWKKEQAHAVHHGPRKAGSATRRSVAA